MQNKIILIFFLLYCSLPLLSKSNASKKLLTELDKVVSERESYIKHKADRIDYLKQILKSETNPDRVYNITYQLIEEYSNFQADSAFVYIEKNRHAITMDGTGNQLLQNRFQYIFVLAQSGLLNEAERELDLLLPHLSRMNREQKADYYRAYQRLYMNLKEFSQKTHLEAKYGELEANYCDSILLYTPQGSEYYYLYSFKKEFINKHYDKARTAIEKYIQKLDTVSNDAARGYYHLSEIYRAENNHENEIAYLIKSVEADLKSAVKQNRSMRVLAEILYQDGDVKRAYNYLRISLQDANFYNTRLRNTQIAEALPIIEEDYVIQRNEQEFRLKAVLAVIALLFVLILTISIYLQKKRIDLANARRELIKNNEVLTSINNEIEQKNLALNLLTEKLKDSAQVNEKYIGHFLKLCSAYIQRIGEFKKTVNRKIKVGQIEELHNLTLSTVQQATDFKDFYREFDNAFLDIYPNFVEGFNALLKEGQRFAVRENELLNTELRIFALIRLGIKDSSQIAEFMNYTAVTIYSYRTKVKSRAINKETFDQDILLIER